MTEKKHWFEDWFNSPYYHLLYNYRNEEEAADFLNNLSANLNLKPNAKIWDLACGNGRHCFYLAKNNYLVTGTDLSPENIQSALKNKTTNCEFYTHDMRNLFRTNYFDCVLNIFTSLGYFENEKDNEKVFKVAYDSLKKNGLFVVDFFNKTKVMQQLKCEHIEHRAPIDFYISKKVAHNRINKTIKFETEGKTFEFTEQVSLFDKADFENFAAKRNFKLINTYGDYQLNVFSPEHSERLILVFQK
ncbi:MAG: class I SAM-dependent methyltransferase [Sphingobacteriaceae bacterium]|nr:class I SAM-dependent methyltransferase [Sphingobacteriaceae bacterium]